MGLEQLGGEHRREGQRDEARDRDRAGDGDSKFREQTAGVALHEGDRNEHSHQHERGGDNCEAHLAGAVIGGDERRFAKLFHAPVSVFQHHDGVVHDEADGEHEGEQGEQVQRQAEHIEDDEGADHRDGHGDGRDDGGAEAAEEQEDDDRDEEHGDAEGHPDFTDRGFDEDRAVEGAVDLHPVGEGGVQLVGKILGGLRDVHRVGGRLLDDAEADHRLAIAAEGGAVIDRAALDPGHVAEADEIAFALGNHEAGEVVHRAEGAVDTHCVIEIAGFEVAGGGFDIFRAQRAFDVGGNKAARGKGPPVDPDAHRIIARAAHLDAGHAVQRGEAVNEVAVGIVGEFRRRELFAGEVHPEDHVIVGVGFLDFRRIGFVGQQVHDARYAVAHVVGSRFNIAVDAEFDRDVGAAVRRARVDEAHAFDTGDAVFDDLGDTRLDDGGRGAGIVGRDRDDRRVDVGILAQGKACERHEPEHDDDQRKDRCEDRPLDRGIRQQHGGLLPVCRRRLSASAW